MERRLVVEARAYFSTLLASSDHIDRACVLTALAVKTHFDVFCLPCVKIFCNFDNSAQADSCRVGTLL